MTDPLAANPLPVVLCSSREGQAARRRVERELVDALRRRAGVSLIVMPHLYDLAPEGPGVEVLRSTAGELAVLAWMPERALHATLAQFEVQGACGRLPGARKPSSERTIWCVDLRPHAAAETVVALLEPLVGPASGVSDGPRQVEESTRPRWYPVVDRQRCVNCLECLNFCLFGVYELDASGKVAVQQPDACRPGCPACARVCPSHAIMFPEHADPGIAGEVDAPADAGPAELDDLVDGLDRMEL